MEFWNYEAHNCNNLINEILQVTSDNEGANYDLYRTLLEDKTPTISKMSNNNSYKTFVEYMKIINYSLEGVDK